MKETATKERRRYFVYNIRTPTSTRYVIFDFELRMIKTNFDKTFRRTIGADFDEVLYYHLNSRDCREVPLSEFVICV